MNNYLDTKNHQIVKNARIEMIRKAHLDQLEQQSIIVESDEWAKIAGEKVRVERLDEENIVRVHGSELACLRLYKTFHGSPEVSDAKTEYSPIQKNWVFSIKENRNVSIEDEEEVSE